MKLPFGSNTQKFYSLGPLLIQKRVQLNSSVEAV